MCLNRVETADSLCIVQAFSPCFFQQDDLPGPNLLLQFWQGQLTDTEHYEEWKKELDRKKNSDADWPQQMPLFCRGCSDAIEKDVRVPLKAFPKPSKTKLFEIVVAQGMERFCLACRRSKRLKNLIGCVADDKTTEVREVDSETKIQTKTQCTKCLAYLGYIFVLIQRK